MKNLPIARKILDYFGVREWPLLKITIFLILATSLGLLIIFLNTSLRASFVYALF